VIQDEEQHSLNDEKQSTFQNLGGEEELSHSIHVKISQWLLHTLRNAGKDPKSAAREHRPPKKF
jgi:hypothetical protein